MTETEGLREQYDPHPCMHEGCDKRDTVQCRLPLDYPQRCSHGSRSDKRDTVQCRLPYEQAPDLITYFCVDHCVEEGYCYICGLFCTGVEAFNFSEVPGACSECAAELREDSEDANA